MIGPDRSVFVDIAPEVQPINDSAWFAFRIAANVPGPITVTLRYEGGGHRYHPKLSTDGATWRALPAQDITVSPTRRQAQFTVTAPVGALYLAAQPLETARQALDRWREAVAAGRLLQSEIGRSASGAPLHAFATPVGGAQFVLVLLARQHPPEAPGGFAFDAFLARLLEDDDLARAFRSRVSVLAIPVMNPDGLARGHWRTNANGVDLNRDWFALTQPETRAADRAITHAAKTRTLIGLIDFHATRRDVIYAQPAQDPLFPGGLAEDWFARWRSEIAEAAPPISRAHDPSQGNAKTWARLRFGVSGVTYEVGDETDQAAIVATARAGAQSYMQAVIALPADTLVPIQSTSTPKP